MIPGLDLCSQISSKRLTDIMARTHDEDRLEKEYVGGEGEKEDAFGDEGNNEVKYRTMEWWFVYACLFSSALDANGARLGRQL